MIINREKVINLTANRQLNIKLIKVSDIEAAEFRYIRGSLKEDLYEQIIADPFSTDPDFTTGEVDFSDLIIPYAANGLTVRKAGASTQNISAITLADPAVFTCAGHGYSDGDIVYIEGIAKDADGNELDEINKKLQYMEFKIANKATDTFQLTSNIVNDYLIPPLAYFVMFDCIEKLWVEISDRGVHQLNIDSGTNVDRQSKDSIKQTFADTADALLGKALDYIEEQDYSEYEGTKDDEDKYLSKFNYKGGQVKRNNYY